MKIFYFCCILKLVKTLYKNAEGRNIGTDLTHSVESHIFCLNALMSKSFGNELHKSSALSRPAGDFRFYPLHASIRTMFFARPTRALRNETVCTTSSWRDTVDLSRSSSYPHVGDSQEAAAATYEIPPASAMHASRISLVSLTWWLEETGGPPWGERWKERERQGQWRVNGSEREISDGYATRWIWNACIRISRWRKLTLSKSRNHFQTGINFQTKQDLRGFSRKSCLSAKM